MDAPGALHHIMVRGIDKTVIFRDDRDKIKQKAQKEEYDERILGSGDFVQAILKEAEEKERRQMKIRRVGLTLSRLIEEEVEKSNVSLQELKNGSRRKVVSGTRAKIARRGINDF